VNKKIKLIIFILILVLLVVILRSTFSKYANEATAVINEEVGKWVIKLNDTDITTETASTDFNMDKVYWDWDSFPHVKYPNVAPGMKGYFDLVIDPTDTDVSMKYTVEIDDSNVSIPDVNIKITDIQEINGKELTITSNPDGPEIVERIKKLAEIQSENENERLDTIRIFVEWENNEDNNETDSEIGKVSDNVISIPIKVNVIQYTGN